MEKEFVPYELVAKLKELGFDESCFGHYDLNGLQVITHHWYPQNKNSSFPLPHTTNNPKISAPTFSQAFRWFREKYQIFPEVLTDCTTEPKFVYTYNTFYGNPKDLTEQEWGWENNIGQYSDIYRTYEGAELACLDKLIEIVENKSE
jgi:hypothetical protein